MTFTIDVVCTQSANGRYVPIGCFVFGVSGRRVSRNTYVAAAHAECRRSVREKALDQISAGPFTEETEPCYRDQRGVMVRGRM